MMKKVLYILHYVVMFITSIAFTGIVGLYIFQGTVLNEEFVLKQFNKEHYQEVEEAIKLEMKYNMTSSGVDGVVVDTMFDYNDVRGSVHQLLDMLYVDSNISLDTDDIRSALRENIINDFTKKNFFIEDESELDQYVDTIVDIYRREFLMLNQTSTIHSIIVKANTYSSKLLILCWIVFIVFFLIGIKHWRRVIPVSFLVCCILLYGISKYVYVTAGLDSITIFSATFSSALRKILAAIYGSYMNVAYLFFILGIVLSVINVFIPKRIKKGN